MNWIEAHPLANNFQFVQGVSEILAKTGGDLSAELNRLVQKGDYRQVVDRKIDYSELDDVEDVRSARSIQALFAKAKDDWFGYGSNPTQVALQAFMKAEQRCLETNDRLSSCRPSGLVSVVSYHAQRKIAGILGSVPSLDSLKFQYGPGATTNVKSAVANAKAKLSASPVCSEDMLPFVGEFLAEFPYLTEHHSISRANYSPLFEEDPEELRYLVEVQVGNGKLTFVPKNVKTKRPIVVEPILNGLAQKGIGRYIRDRLQRVCNLSLRDQGWNQTLAHVGSVNGEFATIDLASASDTLSILAVMDLLPPDWVDFLGRYRTGKVVNSRQTIELQKWSSMGNGYTFELESLIFYGLACGCAYALGEGDSYISVYGDDIIVSPKVALLLSEVLDWFGFEVNTEKSYWHGPFRESCGADWFKGIDVRPFYLKERISDRVLFTFHNWAMRSCQRELATYIHDWTHPHNRIYGPDGYGDGHLLGDYCLRYPRRVRRSGWGGGFFDTFSLKPKRRVKTYAGDWLLPGYSVYTRSGEESETDPDIVRGSNGYQRLSIYTLASSIFGR